MALVDLANSTILVVDDTIENLDFLSEFLERAGYRILVALDGNTAFERASHVRPDLILLDVLMPDIDGFEVCRKLKEDEVTKDIPVIFMTALNETIDKLKGFELGAVDFISKPYEPQELLARIKNHLTLKLLQEKLQEANQNLEHKVEERTARLKAANIDLENEIAERRKTAIKLKEALEKAQEASELKSAFLMMVSHEIRTPLNAILGFTNIMLNEELESRLKGYLNIIYESGESLLNIISDIIDLSLLETNKLAIYQEPTCLKTIFTRLYYQIENYRDSKNKGIFIKEALDKNINNEILCDAFRLNQVLYNLLLNAVKFTDEGIVEFGTKLRENVIEFYVKDTGIGIPAEKQETVFDSFRQADMSDSREFGGMGLGLAISKKLVELMGGEIWLQSSTESPHGTTVFFTMPYKPVHIDELQEEPKENMLQPGHGLKVLVVEDDKSNQAWVQEILTSAGIEVCFADNGREGVECFSEKQDLELILMDIQMPVMNGYDAVREIRALEAAETENEPIPIIALTAAALQEDRIKCLECGCDAYIAKPVEKDDLLKAIFEHMSLND